MPSAPSYTQESFSGGMNLVDLGTRVKGNEYILGINLRSRFGYLEPIKAPLDRTGDLPVGDNFIQGVYAFGEILVAFVGGQAWYLNAGSGDDDWTQILGFQMSETVDRIYAQPVPASSLVYLRKNSATDTAEGSIILDPSSTNGVSEVALVCQDGENQPWLIFSDGTTRVAGTYTSWDVGNREYVPIGKQMAYSNGVLYVVSADGKKIYRSVTGRPLDFVIAIDNNGAKVADAEPLSIAVDSNEIKLIALSNAASGVIVISAYSAYIATPRTDKFIYGEPEYDRTYLFTAGTINQFCWSDLLGDFAFIDREGLKSFNAVSQLKVEGNNSVFSLGVSKLFDKVVQDSNACVGSYDNYTFFSVKTTQSPSSIIVYDNIKSAFCSVDILSSKPVKQFATTYSASKQRFFGATADQILELYSPESEEPLSATVFPREIDSRSTDQGASDGVYNIKPNTVRLIFEDGVEEGECFLDTLVNNSRQTGNDGNTREIPASEGGIFYPVTFPVMFSVENGVVPIDIPVSNKREGQKVGYILTWTGGAKLTYFIARCEIGRSASSKQQQARIYS